MVVLGGVLFLMSEVPLFLMSEVPLFLMSEVPLWQVREVPYFDSELQNIYALRSLAAVLFDKPSA